MDRIEILPAYRKFFSPEDSKDIEGIAARFGLEISGTRKRSRLARSVLGAADGAELDAFLKVYAHRSGPMSGWFRSGLGPREARHLMQFRRWGIPAVPVIGWGVRRSAGGLRRESSFVITESAADALPLLDFWTGCDQPPDSDWRKQLIADLAGQVALLHRRRFCHQDLKWRNLLVVSNPEPGVSPWVWIDCPNGYRSHIPWRQRHGRIKDLATLDKVARFRCTEEERMDFVRIYLGQGTGAQTADELAAAVARYRRRRQDD
ncbi:MAG TPA: lipopolysaccharide kinase InaA family protein [Verrucomicrobiales bacterium]|nr:lipopolysaccharide kinase InaA family protein [Verrucomicrobiales bacterium]